MKDAPDVINSRFNIPEEKVRFLKSNVSQCVLGYAQLFANPSTRTHQAPLSMRFSRQEYWSRLSFPTPGDLPDPRIKPDLLHFLQWQVWILYHSANWEAHCRVRISENLLLSNRKGSTEKLVKSTFLECWKLTKGL